MTRQYAIRLTTGGARYRIERDVCHEHPDAVHVALGTASEAQLQELLDAMSVDDWYDADGTYRGSDPSGLEMFWVR